MPGHLKSPSDMNGNPHCLLTPRLRLRIHEKVISWTMTGGRVWLFGQVWGYGLHPKGQEMQALLQQKQTIIYLDGHLTSARLSYYRCLSKLCLVV